MESVMEVRKYTPSPGQAVSSLRVARIANIWQSPLLVAALMPPSAACVCVQGERHKVLLGGSSFKYRGR